MRSWDSWILVVPEFVSLCVHERSILLFLEVPLCLHVSLCFLAPGILPVLEPMSLCAHEFPSDAVQARAAISSSKQARVAGAVTDLLGVGWSVVVTLVAILRIFCLFFLGFK